MIELTEKEMEIWMEFIDKIRESRNTIELKTNDAGNPEFPVMLPTIEEKAVFIKVIDQIHASHTYAISNQSLTQEEKDDDSMTLPKIP